MKLKSKMSILLVLTVFYGSNAFGDDASSQKSRGRRHGPSPEAYTACEGKKAGDAAQFVSPRGETVTGTCAQEGERLVLRPDRPKGNDRDGRRGPPPEAYKACEGKSAGSSAQFINPRGETVTGTCVDENGTRVLRPDHRKHDRPGPAPDVRGQGPGEGMK
jgi:hypothetical protein